MTPELQYISNAELFKRVRILNKASLRNVAKETGVMHVTIHRLENGRNVMAKDYIKLMMWAVKNNPNIQSNAKEVGK